MEKKYKKTYELRGKCLGSSYKAISTDMKHLQKLLTRQLRKGCNGFIFVKRLKDE